jgi:hypothetical protein
LTSVTEEPIICQSRWGFPICVSLKFINWRLDLFSDSSLKNSYFTFTGHLCFTWQCTVGFSYITKTHEFWVRQMFWQWRLKCLKFPPPDCHCSPKSIQMTVLLDFNNTK